ncbi:MAG: hypothetical protein V7711_12395 [Pseudomonadales bacterium]
MLSADVVASLVAQNIVDKKPSGKQGLAATQAAFDQWQQESGLPLSHISRIISYTVK